MRPSRRQSPPFIRRWTAGYPSVTVLLIALSVGAFAAQCIVGWMLTDAESKDILGKWLALDSLGISEGRYWKFATYGFLHAGVWPFHIAANMLLLYFAGREVEPIVGKSHFLAIFAIGNVIGGVADWIAMHSGMAPEVRVVGVSAGVAAVIVAFTTILPELEVTMLVLFVIPLRLRAKHLAMALVLATALLCFTNSLDSAAIGPVGMLVASLFAWAYVKQLGYGNPLPIQRFIFEKRQREARLARMSPEQFMRMEIDPILEKISREGMRSLSRAERKILDQGRNKMIGKTAQKQSAGR